MIILGPLNWISLFYSTSEIQENIWSLIYTKVLEEHKIKEIELSEEQNLNYLEVPWYCIRSQLFHLKNANIFYFLFY